MQQWLICIGLGLTVLPINLLLKIHYIPELPVEEPIANEAEEVNEVAEAAEATKDELRTDANLVKIRKLPKFPSAKLKSVAKLAKPERKEIVNIGF